MNTKNILLHCLLVLTLSLFPATQGWSESSDKQQDKVLYHVDDSKNARWALMLANIQLERTPDAKIVFVTYGPGVDFLLSGSEDKRGNAYGPRIKSLSDAGVEFRICEITLDARNISKDRVLDGIQIVPEGLHEIVRLQNQEGFAYLKP